jgi:PTH1 family peptidyl-tRNA hydrolase
MKIIVGLGNPGPRYETTRHNVGFLAVDRLIDRWNASGPMNRSQGELFEASFRGDRVYLVKPQTYMNLSGRCIGPIVDFYKIAPEDMVVIHDDIDLKPLSIRIKTGGGTGGHNGLKSIDENLGSARNGYHRVRVGVGKPEGDQAAAGPAVHVLQPFTDEELRLIDPLLDKVADAVEKILSGDAAGAMNEYNKRDRSQDRSDDK